MCIECSRLRLELTPKEEKLWRLAVNKGAPQGEYTAAANKLVKSLRDRGVTAYDSGDCVGGTPWPGSGREVGHAAANGPLSPCEAETINFVAGLWRARRWVLAVAVGAAGVWFWPHDKPEVRRAVLVSPGHQHHAKHAHTRSET